jgi:hypothetical protein
MKDNNKIEKPESLTQAEKILEPVLMGMAGLWLIFMFLWIVILA